MKYLVPMIALMGVVSVAHAQSAIPDLKGTWTGKDKSIVFGANPHHPGAETATSPPRVRDYEFTFVIDGQDGRLAWGHNFSKTASTNEPFAWAIANDGKSIMGADTDGYYHVSMLSADRMELCYAHAGVSPSRSIVATCCIMERVRK